MDVRIRLALTLLLAVSSLAPQAHGQLAGEYLVTIQKKQQEKRNTRWTLAEWLAQKDRNRMMDLWLAQNSTSSPFEFLLEGRSLNYNATIEPSPTVTNQNLYGGAIGAYAGVVGLRGGYATDSEKRSRWEGSLNFRLFGRQMQDTHINIQYGIQGMDVPSPIEKFQNQFAGIGTNLYLTKYFGLSGSYQRIFPAESNLENTMEGERSAGGLFIDFGALRIFGEWNRENLRFSNPSSVNERNEAREGFGGGLQLYF